MPLTKEIERKAKDDVTKWISYIIDKYLKEGVTIYDLKKYFRINKSFGFLLKDISYVGRRYFEDNENKEDYDKFVKKILNNVIEDRLATIETEVLIEKKVIRYDNFLNENIDFSEMTVENLFNDIGHSDDDMDIIADCYDTKEEFIKSEDAKYNVYSVVDFKGDILKNNRTSFKVLLLADFQIEKMKQNIIKKVVSGIYAEIPESVDYMGIRIKPHSVMDKGKILDSLKQLIQAKDILNLITKLTKYNFDKQHGDHYLWKKNKQL